MLEPNFCFEVSANWFLILVCNGENIANEETEGLQLLFLHLPLQSLCLVSFSQDFVLQQSFLCSFEDWSFEQDFCSVLSVFLAQA